MHSFHHSRGRIFFEAFGALAVSASCVGAWMQTGASALLGAAAVAALYGLWHLTDLGARKPQVATGRGEEAVVEDRPEPKFEQLTAPVEVLGLAEAVEVAKPPAPPVEMAELEPAPPPKSQAKRPRARRKSSPREEAKVVELAPPEEPAIEIDVSAPPEEDANGHVTPLFETDPFARMPRRAFGRKAG
jgi:hypothetical protein